MIGNIYKEDLKSIINAQTIQDLRRESLNGNLTCYANCTLLKKNSIIHKEIPVVIDYKDLKILSIKFSEACNIKCVFCRQDHSSKDELDFKILIRHIDLSHFRTIIINGGEPFFIKAAREFFDYVSSAGKNIVLLTNGLLIDEGWAEKIAKYASSITISLNAATKKTHEAINRGSEWEKVLRNIQNIRTARERLCGNVKISGHMTIVRANFEEIPLFIRTFRRLGFDKINFGYDCSLPNFLKKNPFKKLVMRYKITEAFKSIDYSLQVDAHRLRLLGLLK